MKKYIILLFALLLCNCTDSLGLLKQVQPHGNEFQKYLASYYKEMAELEADQYDWIDSAHFARKGLVAAKGHTPPPEELGKWKLPKDMVPTLSEARKNLVEALEVNHNKRPEIAARAQFFFDCWVEQQEENWQEEDIKFCRDNFYKSMHDMHMKFREHKAHAEPQQDLLKEEHLRFPLLSAEVTPEMFKIYFDFDSAKVDAEETKTVHTIADYLKKHDVSEVVLNGHTDTVGTDKYNNKLSERRANSVKAILTKLGITTKKIVTHAFGKTKPAVNTGNNVKERANRRVEVLLEVK